MYYLLYEQNDIESENIQQEENPELTSNQTLSLLSDYILKYTVINQIEKIKETLTNYVDKYPNIQYVINIIEDIKPALHALTTNDVLAIYDDIINTLTKLGQFVKKKTEVENNA